MDIRESVPEPDHGLHGVLRYRREVIQRKIGLLPRFDDDQLVWCEFCGKQLKHPSDYTQDPEDFCCVRYKELFEKVVEESRFLRELSAEFLSPGSDSEDHQEFGGARWLKEELRLQKMEMEKFLKEAAANPPEHTTRKKEPAGKKRSLDHMRIVASMLLDLLGLDCVITSYPSGNLAIIVLVDDTEAVCLVHDDISTGCPIRAVFSSEGRATCYHDNGNIWLSMDKWGGQCLDDNGSRTRKWSWADHGHRPVTLRPVCLSLNKNVGVRVLGRDGVFVGFLASGRQARFSVGSSSKTVDRDPRRRRPSVHKDELMVQACRFYIRLALARSRWCLRPDPGGGGRPRIPPFLLSVRQRLLRLSSSVQMDEKDRVFIQRCLQERK